MKRAAAQQEAVVVESAVVRDARQVDRAWIYHLLHERWQEIVVSRGKIHTLDRLPALVAEFNGVLAGCLTYCTSSNSTEVVTVDAAIEGRGVGRALMFAAHERFAKIRLITTNDNLRAQRFYEHLGMRLIAVHVGAIAESRRLKPSIPLVGHAGIPITDELEYEW